MWNKKSLLLLSLLGCCTLQMLAAPKEKPKAELDSIAFHGAFVGINLVSAGQMALGQNGNINIQADVNLYNRFNPCLVLGYAPFDISNEEYTRCQGQGFYGKIGVNVPISKYGPNAENQFFGGVRYAYSNFKYQLENVRFPASYWGDAYSMNFRNERAGGHWLEIDVGMRMQVLGPITLGWTLDIKKRLAVNNGAHSVPAFIPGYGPNRETNYGFAFNFYYLLPIKIKSQASVSK